MITRAALLNKLDEMDFRQVLVDFHDYNPNRLHPLMRTPLQKAMCELVGAKSIQARTYTDKRGNAHSSPKWLVELYRAASVLVSQHYDIRVLSVKAILRNGK